MLTVELESFYGAVSAEITANTSAMAKITQDERDYDRAESLAESTEKKVEEANDLLEQMELSLHSEGCGEAERRSGVTRLNSYKAELKRLLKEYSRVKRRLTEQRQRLSLLGDDADENEEEEDEFGTGSLSAGGSAESHIKDQLLEDAETASRSGRKLSRGRRLLEEARATGAAVLGDLTQQRETVQRARNRLRGTTDDLGVGSRVLSSMLCRGATNRVVLAVVATVVVIVAGIVVYVALIA